MIVFCCATQDEDSYFISPQNALQEFTADISKLVNLRVLDVTCNQTVDHIPDAASCLQKLERLCLSYAGVVHLPISLATLNNLACLCFRHCEGLLFPPDLQVKSLGIARWPQLKCGSQYPVTS
jgi:hypothetical protein